MVPYNEENIKKNKKIIEHNSKILAELLKPIMAKAVHDINNAFLNFKYLKK